MSIFSDERVEDLAEKIYSNLLKRGYLLKENKSIFKTSIKKGFVKFYRLNEQIEEIARRKIKSMAKAPIEGSRDYKVLFEKFFLEEWKKH